MVKGRMNRLGVVLVLLVVLGGCESGSTTTAVDATTICSTGAASRAGIVKNLMRSRAAIAHELNRLIEGA
jgi:hypothetical protein